MYPGAHAATNPYKAALIMEDGTTVTYRELEDRSCQLAQLFRRSGLGVGDRVALLAENHPRYFEVYWAAIRSGLYLTAINRHLSPAEAAYLINDSDAKLLITTKAMS